ncbi:MULTISPECIES: MAB_1171c family putative transporter [unclassified Streptomyces]|uniref:MAB_1171c family putative transporter n=1 Tax=unclassified Streptomyces TaxID=2593676 RepID=UPI00081E4C8F|nr:MULTISPECIES: MAB_1171c family putative transporter [unclassified Streptomyces]MYZ35999.1 hypothetical protein [Streptomyces sp. SID4917]SCF80131.1 hypothetical protein GA0115259_102807 [Streptomyces sp. MnatMP-M17]
MLGFFAYAAATAMTALTVWRLPAGLYGDVRGRRLWGCYVASAAALWLRSPAVEHALNHSPVTDVSVLAGHYAGTAAVLAILGFVAASYGTASRTVTPRHLVVSRWATRIAGQTAAGALTAMTVFFFTVVDRSTPSDDFVTDHAGQWGATAYQGVFYLFLAGASAVCGYQWSSAARRAETGLLRSGLVLMSLSMALAFLYALARTALMWIAVAVPLSERAGQRAATGTEALMIFLSFVFVAGVSIPAANSATARWTYARTLWRIHPLWRDLMTAVPDISFRPPASRLREVTRLSSVEVRLDRWTQDIADAVDQLRHFAPPALLGETEAATAGHPDPQAAAEALWIKASLLAHACGARFMRPSPGLPDKPIADGYAEAAWLSRVQDAYARITSHEVAAVLKAAAPPRERTHRPPPGPPAGRTTPF